ncbi:phosphatidylinositol-specific phospholipase C/glycerophosphodiester phosphodiesterase family protein [Schinkia azotoformans]|uniref:phosphatidylinositol-specific phospholipase C/glycerophosphodiester phosphodiesterase family protein n=1 Tax=Schinkia azotoformans TaxID=1454 RepID=UPI002DBCDC9E|nr:phosphatidylinositol-specific phospholipase C/glycerophosphodiester phosphodiesterase family protein [Schinkia azotoformans]MEC1721245.1 phosphatidylinositol-specific phospholipase C/glycerophosphodiester phosphodiesterase family protein [Schinkia azotoformans]MED4414392.1 phosphatidylinositol-specific phospholipase C/glycerophosphodiester phosphodiesterase family protein [Schinkia azotoformans]
MKKYIWILFIICLFLIVWEQAKGANGTTVKDTIEKKAFIEHRLIAHAMGGIDGKTYTNSKEAMELNYNRGVRAFESDLIFTKDDVLVARHYWEERTAKQLEQRIPTGKVNEALSLEEFKGYSINKRYTPQTFEEIAMFMKGHPDMYLITDTKDTDLEKVKKTFKEIVHVANEVEPKILNQIIPQIYTKEMLTAIEEIYPFETIIYTLYLQQEIIEEDLMKFVSERNVDIVVVDTWRFNVYFANGFAEKLKEKGIYTFVHPVETKEEVDSFLSKSAHGVFSSTLLPKDLNDLDTGKGK